jgi:valyl-tRNA synthetase
VRTAISKELEALGNLVKRENYMNKVGTSERTHAIIEPRLSDQWFLKMEELAKPALEAVLKNGSINLVPARFENTYRHWMENIRDWNISRQLWWGQRIPAYYYGPGKSDFVVAETPELALEIARKASGNPGLSQEQLRQDEDVVDTWFSSWLWPIAVFDGILEPENAEVNYYYPTSDLVTGPDILFFWVARMIMAGYEFRNEAPFKNVYLTGLVRDKQRRKMSKSLGNSPDALGLISQYGADGVRVGLLLSAAAGNDLLFDEALCQQGANFANKIWNAFRLVKGWEIQDVAQPEVALLAIDWYRSRFHQTLEEIEDHFSKYRISDALMATYKLVWDDFCSWLLEMVKPAYGAPIDRKTYDEVIRLFEDNLRLLHPFMPFLSEEIWQHVAERTPKDALVIAAWPKHETPDLELLSGFEFTREIISGIRTIRKDKNIPFKQGLDVAFIDEEQIDRRWDVCISKLANVSEMRLVESPPSGALAFRVKRNEYFVPLQGAVDVEAEIRKIQEELDYTRGFLASVQKKLLNERFVSGAPEQVVALERKKAADAEATIETLEKSLANLK